MAIVVSDTSAIAALVHLGLAHILQSLFVEVFVPPAVAHELKNPRGPRSAIDVAQIRFITIKAPADISRVARLSVDLGAGESEAITLAIELSADWILIDEDQGRRVATELGLHATGVCGILVRAKRDGLVKAVLPLIDQLTSEIEFRISPKLREQVAKLAGE